MFLDDIRGKDGFAIPWADGRFLYFERHEARRLHAALVIKIIEWDLEAEFCKQPKEGENESREI